MLPPSHCGPLLDILWNGEVVWVGASHSDFHKVAFTLKLCGLSLELLLGQLCWHCMWNEVANII